MDFLRPQITGHQDNRIPKAYNPALPICKATIIEDLKEDVPDIRMRFLNLIQEDNTIGALANRFSKLTTIFMTDLAWWSSD